MKNNTIQIISIILLAALASACSPREVGSKDRPFTMYFVPSVDAETITRSATALTDHLSKHMSRALYNGEKKFHIKSAVPTSYIAVVEAFGAGRADFAAFNTFSYVLAREKKKYPVEPLLITVRHGEKTYKAQIVAHKDSGINSLEDLKGRKFAFTDPASTSGFILPSALLKEKGIELGETTFAARHDNVITMIYQRQVDAGATYYSSPIEEEKNGKTVRRLRDARARVITQFPDVEDKVKIIGFSEEVPNEPWVVRSNIFEKEAENQKFRKALTEGLLSFAATQEGKDILNEVYNVTDLAPATPETFAKVSQIILSTDMDIEDYLKKKAKKKKK